MAWALYRHRPQLHVWKALSLHLCVCACVCMWAGGCWFVQYMCGVLCVLWVSFCCLMCLPYTHPANHPSECETEIGTSIYSLVCELSILFGPCSLCAQAKRFPPDVMYVLWWWCMNLVWLRNWNEKPKFLLLLLVLNLSFVHFVKTPRARRVFHTHWIQLSLYRVANTRLTLLLFLSLSISACIEPTATIVIHTQTHTLYLSHPQCPFGCTISERTRNVYSLRRYHSNENLLHANEQPKKN